MTEKATAALLPIMMKRKMEGKSVKAPPHDPSLNPFEEAYQPPQKASSSSSEAQSTATPPPTNIPQKKKRSISLEESTLEHPKERREKKKWLITPSRFEWPAWKALDPHDHLLEPANGNPLLILSYHVTGERFGLQYRIPKLVKLLQESHADIICLQDVCPELLTSLAQEEWVRSNYYISDPSGFSFSPPEHHSRPTGHVILSRFPFAVVLVEFPFLNGCQALFASLSIEGRSIGVASVCLDVSDDALRSKQLRSIVHELRKCHDKFICGDFGTNDSIQKLLEGHPDADRFIDCWRADHPISTDSPPAELGLTFDPSKNSMLQKMISQNKLKTPDYTGMRSDRVVVFSSESFWDGPVTTKLVGDQPLEYFRDLFPSAHFGVSVTLRSSKIPVVESSCSVM